MPISRRAKPSPFRQATAPSILIAGDLFRLSPSADARFNWHQANNMRWVRNLALAMFGSLPGLTVDVLDHAAVGLTPGEFAPVADQDADRLWLTRTNAAIEPALAKRIGEAVRGKLVIGYELPAHLRAVIDKHAALLVHLAVSPLRFADDLFLDIACSDATIQAMIAEHAVSDRELFWQAGLTRANLEPPAKLTDPLPDNILLIADQIGNDRAMIVDGQFASLGQYRERLEQLAARHSLTLLKPHPHRSDIHDFAMLVGLPRVRITAANSYALMASGKVKTVAAVSSSLLSEAPYFGVAAERLATPDYQRGIAPSATVRIGALAGPIAEVLGARIGHLLPARGSWTPERSATPDLRRFSRDDWGLSKANRNTAILTAADLDAFAPGEAMPAADPKLLPAFVQGWHGHEDWGAWGNGAVATLALNWPASDPDRIRLSFEVLVVNTPLEDGRDVELWIEGSHCATARAAFSERGMLACVVERPAKGLPLHVHLRTRAILPAERNLPPTARSLGAGLFSMSWAPVVAETEEKG